MTMTASMTNNIVPFLDKYPALVKKAIPIALNKVAVQARNAALKKITRRYNLPLKRIKWNLTVSRKATRANPEVTIRAIEFEVGQGTDRPGLLSYRGTSETRRIKGRLRKLTRTRSTSLSAKRKGGSGGVKVTVIKGRKKLIRGAFITQSFGAVNVFKRTGKKKVPAKGTYKGRVVTRGPNRGQPLQRELIKRRVGPSIPAMFRRKGRGVARAYARKHLGRIFSNQLQFQRSRMKTKGKVV